MAMLNRLPEPLLLGAIACLVCVGMGGSIGYGFGARYAEAQGNAHLSTLKAEHAEQARVAAIDSRVQLLQQVTRANQSEALLFEQMNRHAQAKQQLLERIPHVTTTYRPTLTAAPIAIPSCVFTAGWLRDYNLAIGVSAPTTGTAAAVANQAAWPTPGTDAELLASGVTPADILAHAQDYGRWARDNLAQLNQLLDLQKKD